MLGYVGLCKAIERNVFHILANGEPLYDAYTTYLPINVTADKPLNENSTPQGGVGGGLIVIRYSNTR